MNQQQKINLTRRSKYEASPLLSRARRNTVAVVIVALSFVVLFVLNHDDGTSNSTALRQKPSQSADALRKAIQDDDSVAAEKHTKTNLVDPEAKNVSHIVLFCSNGCVFRSSFCLIFYKKTMQCALVVHFHFYTCNCKLFLTIHHIMHRIVEFRGSG